MSQVRISVAFEFFYCYIAFYRRAFSCIHFLRMLYFYKAKSWTYQPTSVPSLPFFAAAQRGSSFASRFYCRRSHPCYSPIPQLARTGSRVSSPQPSPQPITLPQTLINHLMEANSNICSSLLVPSRTHRRWGHHKPTNPISISIYEASLILGLKMNDCYQKSATRSSPRFLLQPPRPSLIHLVFISYRWFGIEIETTHYLLELKRAPSNSTVSRNQYLLLDLKKFFLFIEQN